MRQMLPLPVSGGNQHHVAQEAPLVIDLVLALLLALGRECEAEYPTEGGGIRAPQIADEADVNHVVPGEDAVLRACV